ncbi:MAG: hypothetical protein PVH91_12100 [Pseudomonadales bacterium]|jgi:hypothetical protein
MKTLHSGSSDFAYVRTDTIAYTWKFEDAEDHEHPYILTVAVDGHTHSEGFEHDIGPDDAAARAEKLAQEVYASLHPR